MHGHQLIIQTQELLAAIARKHPGLTFVEVGSERGSGSTMLLSKLCKSLGLKFITVDADEDVSKAARQIVTEIDSSFEAHHQLAEVYLAKYPRNDLAMVYMDAFDIVTNWPHKQTTLDSYKKRNVELTNENAAKMHLDACQASYQKVIMGGYICFDDVWKEPDGQWKGKGQTGIPFLLNNGYQEIKYIPGHCVLLQRVA